MYQGKQSGSPGQASLCRRFRRQVPARQTANAVREIARVRGGATGWAGIQQRLMLSAAWKGQDQN